MFVLASASPRRQELLKNLIPEFQIQPSEIEEVLNPELTSLGDQVADLAIQKALAIAGLHGPDVWVLGSDTMVCLGDQALGKPNDAADAERMLSALSGQKHQVLTGVALVKTGSQGPQSWQAFQVSDVQMRITTAAERQAYIATGEPFDKAGSYAIQGGAKDFITSISGPYDNIVGLPLDTVRELLIAAGYPDLPEGSSSA